MSAKLTEAIASLLFPRLARKARERDVMLAWFEDRLKALPPAVQQECARRHANGSHGWWCMQQMPLLALRWAHAVEVELAGRAALEGKTDG